MGLSQVTRPRPIVAPKPSVTDAVIEALRGPFRLHVCYGTENPAPRAIEPHGLLMGHRSYLVARQPYRDETILNFRTENTGGILHQVSGEIVLPQMG